MFMGAEQNLPHRNLPLIIGQFSWNTDVRIVVRHDQTRMSDVC